MINQFEINFLDSYTNEELLKEIRRVAGLLNDGPLTIKRFVKLSGRVGANIIRRRFGGWKEALENAGVGHLYGGQVVTAKMKTQPARKMTDAELIDELRRVHSLIGTENLTKGDFDRNSNITSYGAVRARFGGWENALEKAGIAQSNLGRRYTDEECFENLVTVWSHYGRPPQYLEMKKPPSAVGPKAYVVRWGTWRKALRAFVDWVDSEANNTTSEILQPSPKHVAVGPESRKPEDNREVRPGLRFKVFQRDRFRCVSCGRSPATHLNIELHADHCDSVADGGKTTFENLQTLCQNCNLGKGRSSLYIKAASEKTEM